MDTAREVLKDQIGILSKGISFVLKLNNENLCYFNSIIEAKEGLAKVGEEICDAAKLKYSNKTISINKEQKEQDDNIILIITIIVKGWVYNSYKIHSLKIEQVKKLNKSSIDLLKITEKSQLPPNRPPSPRPKEENTGPWPNAIVPPPPLPPNTTDKIKKML